MLTTEKQSVVRQIPSILLVGGAQHGFRTIQILARKKTIFNQLFHFHLLDSINQLTAMFTSRTGTMMTLRTASLPWRQILKKAG